MRLHAFAAQLVSRTLRPLLAVLLLLGMAGCGSAVDAKAGNDRDPPTLTGQDAQDEPIPEVEEVVLAQAEKPETSDDETPADAPQEPEADPNPFPGRFPAPSLDGGVEWFNTASEISIDELRGKIVVFDFWTYCCINCMHILPDLKYLEHKYADQLVVIGVHAAKFDNEKDSENIRRAILRYEIEHPVVNDANMIIARKYMFRAWPQLVIVDPEGQFVGFQTGEGIRDLFDTVIGKMVEYHRAKGTLDETPIRFDLERDKVQPGALKFPGKVLADAEGGRLFISDSNHNRIVIASLDGELLDIIGTGAIGMHDGPYDVCSFDHPQGMELVGNTLYVADTENHLIRTVDLETKTVGKLAGTGAQSLGRLPGGPLRETPLNSPWDVYHLDGTLYVAMAGPHQLWKHTLGSETIEVFAGSGREDILDGPLAYCALAQPSGIASDGKVLYHVDSEGSAVRRVTLGDDGEVTTLVGPHDFDRGQSLFEFGDIDGFGDEVRLQHPIGIDYYDGMLYVTDTYNHKIKRIDPEGAECRAWVGTGTAGTDLEPLQFSEPAGISVAGGIAYIADTNNHRIVTVDVATGQAAEFKVAGLEPPPREQPSQAPPSIPALDVAAQRIKSGDSMMFNVAFELPIGFKLNELGPVTYRISAGGESALIPADALNASHEAEKGDLSATFSVPLSGTGSGTYELSLNYTYCRDGTGGVCKLGRQAWRIPIEVADDATATEIALTASPEE